MEREKRDEKRRDRWRWKREGEGKREGEREAYKNSKRWDLVYRLKETESFRSAEKNEGMYEEEENKEKERGGRESVRKSEMVNIM